MKSMFRSLALVNYRRWFIGAFISNLGLWMQRTAQDWIVLTQLTEQDAIAVGITMGLQFLPQLFLVPISGFISDRFDRRRILVTANSILAALAVGLGTLVLLDIVQLWHVYAFALAGGIVAAIELPSKQGFISELVSQDRLANAVSLNSASFNLARSAGPAVAAMLMLFVGAGWVFYVNALSFAAIIVAIIALHVDKLHPQPRLGKGRGAIAAGFRYLTSRSDLVVLMIMVFLVSALAMNFPIFASTMTVIEFDLGVGAYGALLSAVAVGAVIGALLGARRDTPSVVTVAIGASGLVVALAASAFMPNFWTFAAVFVCAGIGVQTILVSGNATVQLATAPGMRGRVLAIYMAVYMTGTPLGAPFVGWIANEFGPRIAILVGAAGALMAVVVALVWIFVHRKSSGLRALKPAGSGLMPPSEIDELIR